ncbi:MAG TPA: flagellar motor protein MotB [Anaerohalosphaeraceae bacterium]|jgi:flagellar motor protein MotB|nr:flagellar motor protein MotB [Anaerohalosphaeraceae bacterium]HRT49446.1 flagellar motor protein MotB [Anaerohalosphaeraceae bacterium]HRT85390.1 flagellar motor protein MotB [Anaerohalosphaeraceae bacterium]
MSRKRKPEDPPPSAPEWIVTYSDMVTLLLTFFVLLLTMAKEKDANFHAAHASYQRATANFGLPGALFGREVGSYFEHPRILYKVDKGEKEATEDRSMDLATETYRRIIQEIEQVMKIMPSQITCTEKTFHVTDIAFAKGDWTLDAKAKSYLDNYIKQLRESYAGERPALYVVGLAAEEPTPREQWLVSARRAQAVVDYIKRALENDARWTFFSWGAGAGGVWTGQRGIFSTKMHIAIAVLTENKGGN